MGKMKKAQQINENNKRLIASQNDAMLDRGSRVSGQTMDVGISCCEETESAASECDADAAS